MKNDEKGFVPIIILGVVLSVGFGIYFYQNQTKEVSVKNNEGTLVNKNTSENTEAKNEPETNIQNTKINNDTKGGSATNNQNTTTKTITSKDLPPNEVLWSIFDSIASSLKNNDLGAYNQLSYIKIPKEEEGIFLEITSFLYEEMLSINKS